ncbi:MAG: hypothetical protein AABX28_03175 [Nanoarchaeota archaeon]
MNIKSKRGNRKRGTHVGVVLSFVIFVTFLIFIYSILGTKIQNQTSKQNVLDNLRTKLLIENFLSSSSVEILTINLIPGTHGAAKDCIQFNIVSTNLEDIINENTKDHLKIKNESGETLDYLFLGSQNNIRISPVNSEQNAVLKIYYSQKITSNEESSISGCKNIDNDRIIRGEIREETWIFESGITSLIDRYEADCGESLKTEFGVSEGSNFWFSFELADETIIQPACREIPNTLNVYAARVPVVYLDENANTLSGFINLIVW